MRIAQEVSTWSKDPSYRVGAVIVDNNKRILSTGYNGLPRKMEDNERFLSNREIKTKFILHAEENALLNLIQNGVSCFDSTMYVYGLPICNSCARLVAQSGISRIVIPKYDYSNLVERWAQSWENSKQVFAETNIKILEINYEL